MWLFWSLDESGIRRIYTWAQNTEFKCKLVVVVYPACPTGYLDLEELLQLRQNTEGKLDFRLYVTNSTRGEKEPYIAISVDMLDTGIDVPELVNIVFSQEPPSLPLPKIFMSD